MNPIDPRSIRQLVVRAPNWLGDSVMALPTLRALRAGATHAQITLVGPWADIFGGQDVADRIITYPRSVSRRLAMTRALSALGADTALLFPNSLESALAARVWGARRVVGFATDGRAWLLAHPVPRPSPRRHQVDEYLELLRAFELEALETTPTWNPTPSGVDAAIESLLRGAGLAEDAPLVGLHLGAAFGPSKLWSVERWAALAAELTREGLTPVLLGAARDLPMDLDVRRRCPTPVVSLVGRDTPALLPRLLSRFTLLISGDTGVAQLAAALDVGVVTLFGPTDPLLTAPRGKRVLIIAKRVPCAPCFLTECPIDHPCMGGISVNEVAAAALTLARAAA